MGRLDGKVALITGGARGMGKSHVRHFVAEGARVVFGDVLDDQGAAVAAGLGEQSCRYVHHDVTSEADWAAAVAPALDAFGRLDVLVNNAGVLKFAAIADMSLADFRRVLEVNAVGCWLGMKAVIEPMNAAGGGSIVNISSIEGFTGAAGLSAYSASKFAVRGMTKAAASELGAVRHPGQLGPSRRGADPDGHGGGRDRRARTVRPSCSRCRWPGSPSRSRSPGWWPIWPPTSRPTRPAASSSPTAASSAGPGTDQEPRSERRSLRMDGRWRWTAGWRS